MSILDALNPEKGLHRLVERPGPARITVRQTLDGEWYFEIDCATCGTFGETYEPGTAAYVTGWHDHAHTTGAPSWPARGTKATS